MATGRSPDRRRAAGLADHPGPSPAQPPRIGPHRLNRAQALRPDRPLPPDAGRSPGSLGRLFRGPTARPDEAELHFRKGRHPPQGRPACRGRSLLAADLDAEASRPVLQRRPRHLRPPHSAHPRRSGQKARQPGRGPAALEDGPRRLSRKPLGHVARGNIAENRGASRQAASAREVSRDTANPAPKMKRPCKGMRLDWTLPVKVPRLEGRERSRIPLPALGFNRSARRYAPRSARSVHRRAPRPWPHRGFPWPTGLSGSAPSSMPG